MRSIPKYNNIYRSPFFPSYIYIIILLSIYTRFTFSWSKYNSSKSINIYLFNNTGNVFNIYRFSKVTSEQCIFFLNLSWIWRNCLWPINAVNHTLLLIRRLIWLIIKLVVKMWNHCLGNSKYLEAILKWIQCKLCIL
jgi:hypothetical protein